MGVPFICVVLPVCEGFKGIDIKECENEMLILMKRREHKRRS